VHPSDPPCPTGRARYADRISAGVARSRTMGGSGAAADPFRCEHCTGWHVPIAIPAQRTARSNITLPV
jgi:hypothetical protein